MDPKTSARNLLAWYRPEARGLPWRDDPQPYHVLVAEFILQQTTMTAALPRIRRILAQWPTISALANADIDDVLAAWSGLGYYRRAHHLHRTAIAIEKHHGGQIPSKEDVLATLPGIGPYTAAAIASTAFGAPAAAVDGNVLRVIGRVLGRRDAATTAAYRTSVLSHVRQLIEHAPASNINQALMDLGNQVCRPRAPKCGECPLAEECAARAAGNPERIPLRRRATKTKEDWVAILAWRGERLLVEPLKGTGVLEGLWCPPLRKRAPKASHALPAVHHIFSHKRWTVTPHVLARAPTASGHARWVTIEEWSRLPTSSLARRLVAAAVSARA